MTTARWGLVVAGLVMFGVTYVAGVVTTAILDGEAGIMAIPFAGPWILLGDSDFAAGLIINGTLQLGGLVLTILGLTLRKQVPVVAGIPSIQPLAGVDRMGRLTAGLRATWNID